MLLAGVRYKVPEWCFPGTERSLTVAAISAAYRGRWSDEGIVSSR